MTSAAQIPIAGPVVFFTGAGVSVGAGLPTYRGPSGIYTDSDREPPHARDVTPEGLPGLWERYRWRVVGAESLRPARAHDAIAAFESASTEPVVVVTQNVDGLHTAAGSTTVLELHGTLLVVRCVAAGHRHRIEETGWAGEGVPACPTCGADCRPGVVLFGEGLDSPTWDAAEDAIREARTIVAVGTTGLVYPAAHLIADSRAPRAERIWINPDTDPPSSTWSWLRGTADDQVPRLVPAT